MRCSFAHGRGWMRRHDGGRRKGIARDWVSGTMSKHLWCSRRCERRRCQLAKRVLGNFHDHVASLRRRRYRVGPSIPPCRFTRVRPHCNFLLIRYGLAALKASICRLRLLRRLQRLHPLHEAFTVWYRALLVCPPTRPEAPSLVYGTSIYGTSLRQSVSPLGSFRLTEQSSPRARENRRVEE